MSHEEYNLNFLIITAGAEFGSKTSKSGADQFGSAPHPMVDFKTFTNVAVYLLEFVK